MAYDEFCIRVCKDGNTAKAKALCQHVYDVMGNHYVHRMARRYCTLTSSSVGCAWNMPGDYGAGVFEHCEGESGEVEFELHVLYIAHTYPYILS